MMLPSPRARPVRVYRWLAALPGLAMLGGVVFANRARPFVLGLPFLLAWLLFWVLATAAVMAFIYRADEAASARAEPGEPATPPDVARAPAAGPASDESAP